MVAAIYSGVIDSLPGGCRQRRYADFWFDADYAAHAPSFVLAALFSGVGIGIALGNEYVLAGLHFAFSSQTLWQGARALWHDADCTYAFNALEKHAIAPMPLAKTEQQIMNWWLLAILYGLAGFGYIIVATFLPLMAKDAGSPLLTAHLWTLVGLSIVPGCFGWLWAAKRWGLCLA